MNRCSSASRSSVAKGSWRYEHVDLDEPRLPDGSLVRRPVVPVGAAGSLRDYMGVIDSGSPLSVADRRLFPSLGIDIDSDDPLFTSRWGSAERSAACRSSRLSWYCDHPQVRLPTASHGVCSLVRVATGDCRSLFCLVSADGSIVFRQRLVLQTSLSNSSPERQTCEVTPGRTLDTCMLAAAKVCSRLIVGHRLGQTVGVSQAMVAQTPAELLVAFPHRAVSDYRTCCEPRTSTRTSSGATNCWHGWPTNAALLR